MRARINGTLTLDIYNKGVLVKGEEEREILKKLNSGEYKFIIVNKAIIDNNNKEAYKVRYNLNMGAKYRFLI